MYFGCLCCSYQERNRTLYFFPVSLSVGDTMNISKFVIPEVIFGSGSLQHIGESVAGSGASKVLLVTDKGLLEAGWIDKTVSRIEGAGVDFEVFSELSSNPKDKEVSQALARYQRSGCDAVVAVGGGSCADLAKVVAMLSTNPGTLSDYEGINKIHQPLPPIIIVPTTAGTGTEVTQFARIVNTRRRLKMFFVSRSLIPDIAVIDPDLLTTVSPRLAATTGIDALAHAIEAFVSLAATPLTDLHALNAIKLVFANLRQAVVDRHNPRLNSNMALASLNAGIAFSNAILGANHAMTHQVGGLMDTHYGEANAILLPHVMKFNLPDCRPRFQQVARAMGEAGPDETDPSAEQAIEAVINLVADIGLKQSLRDLGLSEDQLQRLTDNVMKDACIATNPRPATPEDIAELFRKAL